MTLTIQPCELRGLRHVKAFAVINKSKKLGIPRRYQKSWSQKTVAPNFACEEMRKSFEALAKRWEQKVMAGIAKEKLDEANAEIFGATPTETTGAEQPTLESAG